MLAQVQSYLIGENISTVSNTSVNDQVSLLAPKTKKTRTSFISQSTFIILAWLVSDLRDDKRDGVDGIRMKVEALKADL